MKLAIVQTKGGVGKTTLAVNVAVECSRHGRSVLLVDADEQGTASGFTSQRTEALGNPGYATVKLLGEDVYKKMPLLAPHYDDIVIDAGGRDNYGLRAALTVADVALIPFQPRSFDIWTSSTIAELVAEGRISNKTLRALAVLNCADPQGNDNAEAAEVLRSVPGIDCLPLSIGRRKAFPNAASEGLAVTELKRPDGKASAELAALIHAIYPEE